MQAGVKNGGVLVTALLAGHFLGAMAARMLRARNFDAALRLPGAAPTSPGADSGFTPTFIAGMLVRLTAWAWKGTALMHCTSIS